MKLCVYAICKNELKFVDKWLENMSEADYIVVLDTGSTDGTYEALQKDPRVTRVEQKEIKPWRFDVARNESMKLIPEDTDICICTDLDELFIPGWADKLRTCWKLGETTRAEYTYAWSHTKDGKPENIYKYNKIHAPGLYKWIFPCHEVLYPIDELTNERVLDFGDGIYLHHYRDDSKKRYYLDLLKLSAEENPDHLYAQMMYARELIIEDQVEEGLNKYFELLKNPKIDDQDNHLILLDSLLQVAAAYFRLNDIDNALWYAVKFISVDPSYREPYLLAAEIYILYHLPTIAAGYVEAAKKYCYQHYSWVEHSTAYLGWLDEVEDRIKKALIKK